MFCLIIHENFKSEIWLPKKRKAQFLKYTLFTIYNTNKKQVKRVIKYIPDLYNKKEPTREMEDEYNNVAWDSYEDYSQDQPLEPNSGFFF